ncbi:MAG: transporter substrate-binding domain-containing protein [Pseudomonadota bacterium]
MQKKTYLVRGWRNFAACLLIMLSCSSLISAQAGETQNVVLLIRELRGENGDLVVIRDDIRQLLNYLEREAQLHFEIRYYPMQRLLLKAKAGEGVVFGLSKNSERLQSFRYSDTIYSNYVWLVTRQDANIVFNELSDLRGHTIGVIRGMSYGDEFERQKDTAFKVEEDISSHVARLKKLSLKRMDIMLFGDRRSNPREVEELLHNLQRQDRSASGDDTAGEFKVLNKPLLVDALHFAAAFHTHDAVLDRLNLAIATGKKSGEMTKILIPPK